MDCNCRCGLNTIPRWASDYEFTKIDNAKPFKDNGSINLIHGKDYNEYKKNYFKNLNNSENDDKIPNNTKDFYNYISNLKNKEDFITSKSNENGYITGQRLNAILGYDKLPKKVSKEEFDKEAKKSEFGTLYRGVSGQTEELCKKYVDNFKNGYFYSGGQAGHIYGKGTYTGFSELGKSTAYNYANQQQNGRVIEMVLDSNSKIINYYDLLKEVNAEVDEFIKDNYKKYGIDNYMKLITNLNKISDEDEFMTKYILNIMHDVGYNASIKGYDAIIADNELANQKYIVILNRGKVIVSE